MKKSENKIQVGSVYPHFESDFNLKSSFILCSRQVF
jgi:hypothetical protein